MAYIWRSCTDFFTKKSYIIEKNIAKPIEIFELMLYNKCGENRRKVVHIPIEVVKEG